MKKKIITVMLLLSLTVFAGINALAADKEVQVRLDGSELSAPALIDGTTVWLPFRAVCEALGYTVSWASTGGVITVSAVRDGNSVTIDVSHQKITQNRHQFAASVLTGVGVRLLSGRTYVESGLFSSIFPALASYDSNMKQVSLTRRYENNVTVAAETISSQDSLLKTTVQYPQLSGLNNQEAMNAINALLKQAAAAAVDTGTKNAADMAQAIKDGYTGAVGACETYFDYMITYNQNGLLCVVLTDYQYAGGAHGSTVQTAYTFDLATGKTLKLSDLMNGKTDYTAFIDAAIRKEIDGRVAAGILSEFDFSPFKSIGAEPEYFLSGDGVVFYFQQYAYFPYAAGIQEFSLPYSSLAPMLNGAFRFLASQTTALQPGAANTLPVGDIGRVVLSGNPTTGYTWHYTISNSRVLGLVSSDYTSSSRPGLTGAGGSYVWNFKATEAGNAAITFKYYRDWEGEASATAENTVVYNVTVS